MKITSIRKRLVLGISVFIAILLLVIAGGTDAYFTKSTRQMIFDQQFSMVSSMAQRLDAQLTTSLDSLNNVAKVAPDAATTDREIAQKWLNDRVGIRTIFNHSLLILNEKGILLVSSPAKPEIYGLSYAHRDYFKNSLATGSSYISTPFITEVNDHPVIMMTAPIRAPDGTLKGFLCGGIDLQLPGGLFDLLRDTHIGSQGYLYLFTQDRTIIMHPDLSRIMKQDIKPGMNFFIDKALTGFEGSGETINSKGIPMLASFKRLQSTGWILAANYPVSEAYQPLISFSKRYFLGMFIVLLISIILACWFSNTITQPLANFTQLIQKLAEPGADRGNRFTDNNLDELKLLGNAFNTLIDAVDRNEQELKTTNILLNEAVTNAEAGTVAKSNFLANMSHEIRTPINGIMGFIDLLDQSTLTAKQQDFVNEAKSASTLLLHVINDILDFSKLEAGKLPIEKINFRIRTAIEDAVSMLLPKAAEKNIALHTLFHATVPEEVIGDPARLKQIVSNLVNNAVKFTEMGDITVTVDCTDEANQIALLKITVQDTGIGISPENLTKLFQSFVQADASTTRKYGGTGLGLAITKELVGLMDGTIRVESIFGAGSTFYVEIRLQISKKLSEEEPVFAQISGSTIMIIDDNHYSRTIVGTYLSEVGCNVLEAQDANEGIASIRELNMNIDIAIIDYQLPNMDGYELANTLKTLAFAKDVKLILFSSAAQKGDASTAKQLGFLGYLNKPVRRDDLLHCIALVLGIKTAPETTPLITKHTALELIDSKKPKILLVDDNITNRKLVNNVLASRSLNCDMAVNGAEALQAVQKKDYDIIFMDCQMPVMNGYDSTREIRKWEGPNKHTTIIAMTAHAMEGDQAKCLAAGMDGYISKPLDFEKLFGFIEEITMSQGITIKDTPLSPIPSLIASHMDSFRKASKLSQEDTQELFDDYFEYLPDILLEITEALERKDFNKIKELAHQLKGSAGNLHITSIYTIAIELEKVAIKQDLDECARLLHELHEF